MKRREVMERIAGCGRTLSVALSFAIALPFSLSSLAWFVWNRWKER
jgi:hypothetical protein